LFQPVSVQIRGKLGMAVPPRPLDPNVLHGQDMDTIDTLEARSNKLFELLNKKYLHDAIDPVKIERVTRRHLRADNEQLYHQYGIDVPSNK
jgi:hypothetical protein